MISPQPPSPSRLAEVCFNSVASGFVRLHFVSLFQILFFESLGFSLPSPAVPFAFLKKLMSSINFLLYLVSSFVNLVI